MRKIFIFALALCLLLCACTVQQAPVTDREEGAAGAVQTEPPAAGTPEVTVDYSTGITRWMYQPEAEEETTRALIAIDVCQYGTAGSSLRQLAATVELLRLTQAEDLAEKLEAYLAGMDDTQRDYFSFQWQMRVADARELLNPDSGRVGALQDIGLGDLDLTQFDTGALEALHGTVTAALTGYGVSDVWKAHTDLEPFHAWDR